MNGNLLPETTDSEVSGSPSYKVPNSNVPINFPPNKIPHILMEVPKMPGSEVPNFQLLSFKVVKHQIHEAFDPRGVLLVQRRIAEPLPTVNVISEGASVHCSPKVKCNLTFRD